MLSPLGQANRNSVVAPASLRLSIAGLLALAPCMFAGPAQAQIDSQAMAAVTQSAKDVCARPAAYGWRRTETGGVSGSLNLTALLRKLGSLGISAQRSTNTTRYSGVNSEQIASSLADYNRCVQNVIRLLAENFYVRRVNVPSAPPPVANRPRGFLWLHNGCGRWAQVAVHYRGEDAKWQTAAWVSLKAGQSTYVVRSGGRQVKATSNNVYVYAEGSNEGLIEPIVAGSEANKRDPRLAVGDDDYVFRRFSLAPDGDGDYQIHLCKS